MNSEARLRICHSYLVKFHDEGNDYLSWLWVSQETWWRNVWNFAHISQWSSIVGSVFANDYCWHLFILVIILLSSTSVSLTLSCLLYNLGPRILHFGSPQGYMNPIMRNMWPSTNKTEAESGYDHHRLLYRIESNKHKQDKGHPLWQEKGPKTGICNESAPRTPISQPILGSIAPSTGGKGNRKLSPDSKPGSFDSGCALYLLSNLQTQSSSELGSMQSSINCPTQSPSSGAVHFDAANTTNLHCNGMLQMGPDGLNMENEDSLTLPIFWE